MTVPTIDKNHTIKNQNIQQRFIVECMEKEMTRFAYTSFEEEKNFPKLIHWMVYGFGENNVFVIDI